MRSIKSDVHKTNIRISGMHCAACTARIERKLMRIDGVKSASASLATHSVYVQYDQATADIPQFIEAITSAGFEYVADSATAELDLVKSVANLKKRFIIALIFSIPVVFIAMGQMVGLPTYSIPYHGIIELLFASVVYLYSGYPFYSIAVPNLRKGVFDMNTLIFVGSTAAYIFSALVVFFPVYWGQFGVYEPYFESLCVIITVILLGRTLEAGAKRNVADSINKLFSLAPKTAFVVGADGSDTETDAREIQVGDRLRLRPGSSVAVDGVVISGGAAVDESILTGESAPIDKSAGDSVYAGTHLLSGTLDYEAKRVGSDTVLAAFIRQVEEAVYSKAPIQHLADKISAIFVPVVVGIAVLSFLLWYLLGGGEMLPRAIISFVTVLIIACPCALGLATPSAIMAAVGRGAREGILIQSGEVLEMAGKIDTVVLDKTGTLTEGKFILHSIDTDTMDPLELLKIAASVEQLSEHPLAKAIVKAALDKELSLYPAEQFNNRAGGVSATVNGQNVIMGTKSYLESNGVAVDSPAADGFTTFYIAIDNEPVGRVTLGDKVRADSAAVIQTLLSYNITPILLSGDNASVCARVGSELGISEIHAEAMPDDKRAFVKQLKEQGRVVAMVGDGVNDAAALAEASVGIAMAGGADIAVSSADITLMGSDIYKLPKALQLARRTGAIIKQNLFWAFIYNVLGIPIAAGVLYPHWHIQLNPMFAGVAMAFSSVTVLGNALRLSRVRLL
ncbi:MAG: cadmium-translocating P-type ATPase [Deferribacteraceae bacterium]|jgi:heavy metal translocating P-type ATPase|nr:cadmium-translocating P-type ATPase [Deferribacteraceae bacterium]